MLMGSQGIHPQSKTVNLPVMDFTKKYPRKEVRLQDIAGIEYVPLETTADILLSDEDILSYVSGKYILVYAPRRGDIFVFNRTGKIYAHFNHRGQSGREYISITGAILDEKNEEIYVCSQSIQVYSLSGVYKRTLNINTLNERKVYNFDDNELLVYDEVFVDEPNRLRAMGYQYNTDPYSLISKKDGSLIFVLDIHLPKRYSNRFYQPLENNMYTVNTLYYPYSMFYGCDFVIADKSSDTLYLLSQNRKLTPLFVRKPSVHASEPRSIWFTGLTTDKFMLITNITLVNDAKGRGGKLPLYMYEFEKGELSDITILDDEFSNELNITRKWSPPFQSPATLEKNMTAELIWPSLLKRSLKAKRLKGNAEKLATKIDEDDNPVVRIVKFK